MKQSVQNASVRQLAMQFKKSIILRVSKSFQFTCVAILLSALSFAQKVQIPENVLQSFKTNFPNTHHIKWDKENNNYEAEFKSNKTEQSAVFDCNGKLIETEVEIAVSKLPESALAYMQTNYKSEKVKEAAKITDSKGIITYEAEIKGKDLIFDNNGKFLKAN